jgi:hypothetical protein
MPTTYEGAFSKSTATELYKRRYGQAHMDSYDTSFPATSQIPKKFGMSGYDGSDDASFYEMVELGTGGGFSAPGSSTLPVASQNKRIQTKIGALPVYYRARWDRLSTKLTQNEGAFVNGLKDEARRASNAFNRFVEMQLFMEKEVDGSDNVIGSGKLGAIAGSGGVSGSNPYVLTMAAGYNKHFFEVGDIVNIEAGNTDRFEVQDITDTTITVFRNSGSQVPANSDEVFAQDSEDTSILGIEGNLSFASGENLYGNAYQYRWQPGYNASVGAGISISAINTAVNEIDKMSGSCPDKMFVSHVVWSQLAEQFEDQKRYVDVQSSNKEIKAVLNWKALEYVCPKGGIQIHASRFCPESTAYLINSKKTRLHHVNPVEWFTDDGSMFLREAGTDTYEGRYGAYMNFFCNPVFHGRMTGISV